MCEQIVLYSIDFYLHIIYAQTHNLQSMHATNKPTSCFLRPAVSLSRSRSFSDSLSLLTGLSRFWEVNRLSASPSALGGRRCLSRLPRLPWLCCDPAGEGCRLDRLDLVPGDLMMTKSHNQSLTSLDFTEVGFAWSGLSLCVPLPNSIVSWYTDLALFTFICCNVVIKKTNSNINGVKKTFNN